MPFKSKLADVFIPDNVSLPDFMVQRLIEHPNPKLLVDPYTKREYSSQQVIETINKVAAGFHKLGLKKGDVVAVALPNMIEYPILLFGLQYLGVIPTVFNPMQTLEELAHQLKDSGATFFVTIPLLLNKVNEVLQKVKGQVKAVITIGEAPDTIHFSDIIDNNGQFPRPKFDTRTTVALVPYSSGTTGLPKGVELTHYNLVANILQSDAMAKGAYEEHETWITFLPFFHIYGQASIVWTAMKYGHTLVVMSKFDKLVYLQSIQEYKASVLPLVPPVVLLLTKDPTVQQYDTSSAKTFISAAAPLGIELESAFLARFPDVTIVQGYGMTELSPCSHMQTKFTKVPGSVGPLCVNMTMKIIDPDSGKELGVGQRGELWLRGPNIMKGYRNNPKATSETIDKEGYLHTGDIGYVDANENLFIVDRLKELIKYKGFQVAPAELEALLISHPDVADVAVIGKPDLEAGELPMAFVVRKKDSTLSAKDLVAWAEKSTSSYKRLRGGVVFVDAIPKSEAGKILRKVLRAKL